MPRPAANPSVAIDVLHRDPALLVVDKPAGLVVEPGAGHARDTLLNGLAALEPGIARLGEKRDWGLLHRLDRDTSGCLLVALDADAYDALRAQFEARAIAKEYLAVVRGRPPRDHGEIDVPLAEVRRGHMKVSVPGLRGAGRSAITRWSVLASNGEASLLRISIPTGRLHQIRAHMALLGCPVSGDRVYRPDLPPNTSRPPPGRPRAPLLLHAWRLGFRHPADDHPVAVTAPPPQAFVDGAVQSGVISSRGLARILSRAKRTE